MSALDALTGWLYGDGAAPPLDADVFAEAVRLLDELAADPEAADLLAELVEGGLAAAPEATRAAWLASVVPGPAAAALLAPWHTAAPADLTARLCGWLFDGAPAPSAEEVAAEVEVARRLPHDLLRLAGPLLGDGAAAARFHADVLAPLEGLLEAAGAGAPAVAEAVPRLAPPPVDAPTGEHPVTPLPRPGRPRGPWIGLAVAAAAAALFFALVRLGPTPVVPDATVTGPVAAALTTQPPIPTPPVWPDAGRPAPAPLAATAARPAMLPVPAGTFVMGSPPDEVGRAADEAAHQVTLTRAYYLGETEVTQAQWASVLGERPARFAADGADRPVEMITWYDALRYLNALSALEGLPACYTLRGCTAAGTPTPFTCEAVDDAGPACAGYRLPSEAEWEHAARAGAPTATWAGPLELVDVRHAPRLDPIAWYSGNSGLPGGLPCPEPTKMQHPAATCGTHPVARKLANPLGFYDMIGNVWEWTGDGYGPHAEALAVDPRGAADADRRVTKGCGWFRDARFCRAANRYRPRPGFRSSVIGLRPARSIF